MWAVSSDLPAFLLVLLWLLALLLVLLLDFIP
jgi:hypothetical protein